MKKILVWVLFLIVAATQAQEASVEKNIFGVQLGLNELVSFQYETKLTRTLAIRGELGFEISTIKRDFFNPAIEDQTTTIVAPTLTIEPRWYYSLSRRERKGKKTAYNSANFISLKTSYQGNSTPIIKNGDFDVVSTISIIPRYGIRRVFATHFNYEFALGIGYQHNFFNDNNRCFLCDRNEIVISIGARIGYHF